MVVQPHNKTMDIYSYDMNTVRICMHNFSKYSMKHDFARNMHTWSCDIVFFCDFVLIDHTHCPNASEPDACIRGCASHGTQQFDNANKQKQITANTCVYSRGPFTNMDKC